MSGSFFGPMTMRARARMSSSSGIPIPNIKEVPLPGKRGD
jgi:hypothetical protein